MPTTWNITIDDEVMGYWVKTKRRTNDARISHLLLCECCKVVFPSGVTKDARMNQSGHVRCARCVRRGCQPNMRKCVKP